MLNAKRNKKLKKKYRKIVNEISTGILQNINTNGGDFNLRYKDVVDSVCIMINDFTKEFQRLKPTINKFTEKEMITLGNLVTEGLLNIGSKTEYVANEDNHKFCVSLIINLISYNYFLRRKQDQEDTF
jgi:hypothetical protein